MDASTTGDAAPEPEAAFEQLRSERDALREEVDALQRTRRPGASLRSFVAVFLVAVFALSFASAGVGIWLHRNTLNDEVWASRVGSLADDPAVQEALATWTTTQLMATVDTRGLFEEALGDRGQVLAIPLTSAVEGFVRERVDRFFASDRFKALWTASATIAHDEAVRQLRGERSAISADGDTITINFVPLLNSALAEISAVAPGLVGRDVDLPTVTVQDVPEEARRALGDALGVDLSEDYGTLTVFDGGRLEASQQAIQLFDRFVLLDSFVAVVAAVAAIAVSPRRRRTVLQLLGVAAVSLVLVRRIAFRLLDEVGGLVEDDVYGPALDAVASTFVDPLTRGAEVALWLVAAAMAVTLLTGPYAWAVTARARVVALARSVATMATERATDDSTTAWVAHHVDALRTGGYVFAVLALWFVDLTWVALLVIAVLVGGWQVLVSRIAARSPVVGLTDAAA